MKVMLQDLSNNEVFKKLNEWKLSDQAQEQITLDDSITSIKNRSVQSYDDLIKNREWVGSGIEYFDYAVFEENELVGFVGYEYLCGSETVTSVSYNFYTIQFKPFDCTDIIHKMFIKSDWVYLPFECDGEVCDVVELTSTNLKAQEVKTSMIQYYGKREYLPLFGDWEGEPEPRTSINEVSDAMKEHGIVDVFKQDSFNLLRSTVSVNDNGSRDYKFKGVYVSIELNDRIVDTYVYPPTEDEVIKAAIEIKKVYKGGISRTLPSSGVIYMSQVNTELGHASNRGIWLGNSDVRQLAGVPSGAIYMSNLRGKSRDFHGTFPTGTRNNYNLGSWIPKNKYQNVNVTFPSGCYFHATATNVYALYVHQIDASRANLTFHNGSRCIGRGGNGGNGGSNAVGGRGGNGGAAIYKNISMGVSVHSGSLVSGGGGGGGGGGSGGRNSYYGGGGGGGGGRGGSSGGSAGRNNGKTSRNPSSGGGGSITGNGSGGGGGHVSFSSKGGGYNETGGNGGSGGTGNGAGGGKSCANRAGGGGGSAGSRGFSLKNGKEGEVVVNDGGDLEITYL